MKIIKLFTALILGAFGFNAGAQDKPADYPQRTSNNYSAIIAQLRLVTMPVDENTKKARYSMDITNIKQIVPFAIATKTTWKKIGKNHTDAKEQPVVELERLVPLLIGALQEHILRVDSLEHELRIMKSKNPGT